MATDSLAHDGNMPTKRPHEHHGPAGRGYGQGTGFRPNSGPGSGSGNTPGSVHRPGSASGHEYDPAFKKQKSLSYVTHFQTGQHIPVSELRALRLAGSCYNCFRPGHMTADCKAKTKPVPDSDPKTWMANNDK